MQKYILCYYLDPLDKESASGLEKLFDFGAHTGARSLPPVASIGARTPFGMQCVSEA